MTTSKLAAVVIPPFIKLVPALWFHMLEATYDLASPRPVKESTTKYYHIVVHLPPEIARVVRDVIMQLDSTDP
ncbi:transposon Ty3-I Gag-Pol polyprotein [Nephila pilipes]|uniref:Transposon Ty3-I Gag-Pol polyprotein n=1 Tax=Nephila pilipes TaxID=299642 RepID=A0A8X6UDH6_NEPPI|nr:transposon Ty3-I Gag-Pol polyprotein [Nephila pilipes]